MLARRPPPAPRPLHREVVTIALTVVALFMPVAHATATTFTVDSTLDAVDAAPGNGLCATSDGACTLRAAIQETNALPGADEIVLPAGTYGLTITGRRENGSARGDLDVTDTLTIRGASSATTIIDGNYIDRIIETFPSETVSLPLSVQGLTLRHGQTLNETAGVLAFHDLELVDVVVTDNVGAGVASIFAKLDVRNSRIVRNHLGGGGCGGGVGVNGTAGVKITDSVIAENSSSCGGGIHLNHSRGAIEIARTLFAANSAGSGGGLSTTHSRAFIHIRDCTFRDNTASFWGGGLVINAAGLASDPALAPFALVNTTIAHNTGVEGGGLAITNNAAAGRLHNVTIARNDAAGQPYAHGGGLWVDNRPGGIVHVTDSILADNTLMGGGASDCSGAFESGGHNLVRAPAPCTITGDFATDLTGVDPGLAAIDDYGGPTPTLALFAGSLAIDGGNPAGCTDQNGAPLAADQRGATRPSGVACDIGAYETGCGNGRVDVDEQCDDGNLTDGDCCSSTCQPEPDDTPCSDADACTGVDRCNAGACVPGTPLACGSCSTCDPTAGCVADVWDDCRPPAARFSGRLQLKAGPVPSLEWQWTKGSATTLADFGDPLGGDRYELCLFDESGNAPSLVAAVSTRAGVCGGKPCWKQQNVQTLKYADVDRTPDGMQSLALKAGGDGKAKIRLSAGGSDLTLPTFPLSLPLRAQLHATNGRCWEARYFELGTRRNDGTIFRAQAFR